MNPPIGLTVNEAAAKLLEPNVETPPEVEPSEVVDKPIETSEEVVEEPEEPVEISTEEQEHSEDEVNQFVVELNDYFKDADEKVLESITIPTKVNGVEGTATLSEVLRTHRIGQASEERLETLKAEKARFEEERINAQNAYSEQLTQAERLVGTLKQQLTGDIKSIEELRETDPAEYSARVVDFQKRQQELERAENSIRIERQGKLNEVYNSIIQKNVAALEERFPEWSDESVALKEKGEIRGYLLSQGYSPIEVDGEFDSQGNIKRLGLVDVKTIDMARKAMLFDRGGQKSEVIRKKVKKLPRVTKPGKPATSQEVDNEKSKAMRNRLKKSGRLEDAAAIIKQKMFGG